MELIIIPLLYFYYDILSVVENVSIYVYKLIKACLHLKS